MLGWVGPVDGLLLARLLISQIASDDSDTLPGRCVAAILATDMSEGLLGELVSLEPPCRSSLRVVAQLLRVLRPGHALADHELDGPAPFALYDAIDDGQHLFVSIARTGRSLVAGSAALLLRVESPTEQVVTFRVARCEAEGAFLEIGDGAAWLERDQIACPPLIVIMSPR